MATVITKTIKPAGGGDYTTLQAAHDALVADLVAADQQLDLVCYAGGNCGQVVFDFVGGWTTDATRYVRIVAADADRHQGVYSTGKAYIERNGADGCVAVPPAYTRIEGMQLRVTGDDNNMAGVASALGVAGIRISGCLIIAAPSSTTFWSANCAGIDLGTNVDGDCFVYNNILIGWGVKAGNLGVRVTQHDAGLSYVYNNTIVDGAIGISDGYSKVVAKNNLVEVDTTAFSGTFNGASNYNATNLTGAPGANSRNSQTFTFVDAGGGDYHLAAADAGARTYGVDLSGDSNLPFSTDIDGQTRPTVWDIGADQESGFYTPPVLPFVKLLIKAAP